MNALAAALPLVLVSVGCHIGPDSATQTTREAQTRIILTSSVFTDGGSLPAKFTTAGPDRSPPLEWRALPGDAKELAVVLTEHTPISERTLWVIYNIPIEVLQLPEAIPIDRVITIDGLAGPVQIFQAINDLGTIGYRGPASSGDSDTTTYTFRLHALDRHIGLKPGLHAAQALGPISSATIASATLTANND